MERNQAVGVRAGATGEDTTPAPSAIPTEYAVGALVIGAVGVLWAIRAGFGSALTKIGG